MNVAPVYFGLENGGKPDWMELVPAPPATLNAMLSAGALDISPVSSAAYARNADTWLLLPDLSISCVGRVMSVLLVSRHPFHDLTGRKVVLTRESATAAALTRHLFALEGVRPVITTGTVRRAEELPHDAGAALVIGDAALRERWPDAFDRVWDLGELWHARTGLPFVFAVWAVRRAFAERRPEVVTAVWQALTASRAAGLGHVAAILPEAARRLGISLARSAEYYRRLRYDLPTAHLAGLSRFFQVLYESRLVARRIEPAFFNPEDFAAEAAGLI